MHSITDKDARILNRPVQITVDDVMLEGVLTIPVRAKGLVVFAQDANSHSAHNLHIAHVLDRHNFATLRADLLTPDEEKSGQVHHLRFDIPLLSDRLQGLTKWARQAPDTKDFSIGYFGAGAGAAAALIGACRHADIVGAVVSCDGRPDLIDHFLPFVRVPVLLIARDHDDEISEINRSAFEKLNERSELFIIPCAADSSENASTLEDIAEKAASWFDQYLHSALRMT